MILDVIYVVGILYKLMSNVCLETIFPYCGLYCKVSFVVTNIDYNSWHTMLNLTITFFIY